MTPEEQNMLPPEQWALGKWIEAKFDDAFGQLDSMRGEFGEYRKEQTEHHKVVDERFTRIETVLLKGAGKKELKNDTVKRFVQIAATIGGFAGFASLFINHG